MFQRRRKRSLLARLKEFLWPNMGWKRFGHYFHLRLIRLKATPYQIACGLAFGASISFVPLPGTHILTAAFLTYLLRGNILASALGTVIGNPWTFPLMWWAAYKIGNITFAFFDLPMAQMPATFEWADLLHEANEHPFELLVPWVTGGFILGLLFWPVFYYSFYRMVVLARKKHTQSRAQKIRI